MSHAIPVRKPTCSVCLDLDNRTFGDGVPYERQTTISELQESASHGCVGCFILHRILNEKQMKSFLWNRSFYIQSNCSLLTEGDNINVYNFSGSEAALTVLRGWIRHCDESHDSCKRRLQSTKLPTRVVEILGPMEIKLRETKNEEGAYTCLSYCWGTESFIRTTTASLSSHKSNIPWRVLPKTHQDAIDVTSRLGFRYIWIDSLCIVQDDLNDWRHEGGKMDQIYSHSSLTIAASKSENPSGGCYMVSDNGFDKVHWFTDTANQKFAICSRRCITHYLNGDHFPLSNRAWAFQERYLSPRVVHFGPQELLWECQVESSCECSGDDQGTTTGWGGEKRQKKDWHQIVNQYSAKTLKFDQDVFPALQGVAKSMAENRTYFAGIWDDNIIEDLLWIHLDEIRPKEWRAPSWSWASFKGAVRFLLLPGRSLEALASVVKIETVPAGSDPFGQLKSAQLILKGCCLRMQLDCYGGDDGLYLSYKPDSEDAPTVVSQTLLPRRRSVFIYGDNYLSRFQKVTVEVMSIARYPSSEREPVEHYYMMFVRVNEISEIYERIGIISFELWFDTKDDIRDLLSRHGREKELIVI